MDSILLPPCMDSILLHGIAERMQFKAIKSATQF